ncbi:MAG: YceI family protein, partial [Xanthomonadales bacterium]|nr:YceI family protein [Xanthomonadales bacterium]
MKAYVLLALMLLPALAFARTWQVDTAHSKLGFDGSFQGGAFHGVFKQFEAKINYDPADLGHASFDVTVNLASVDTGAGERDDTLKGADFFNVAKTPQAHFIT